jgi:hypothetical protein
MVLMVSLLFFGFAGSNSVLADVNTINLAVNGELVNFPDQKPYIDKNNRTMVPVRFPAETLGANVDWLPNTRQVHITNKAHDALLDTDIMATIDRKDVIVNGQTKFMDTTAVITNSRTMVPVRFISEYLGATVTWHESSRAAHVFTKGQTKEERDKIMEQIAQELKKQQPQPQPQLPGQFVKPEGVKKDITVSIGNNNITSNITTYECKNLPIEIYETVISKIEYKSGTPNEIAGNIAGTLHVTKNKSDADTAIYLQGDFGYHYCRIVMTSIGTSISNNDGTYYSIYYFTIGRTPSIETVKKIGFTGKDGIYFIDNPYYNQ